MLRYSLAFFILALIAAFFGFGGLAVGAAGIARLLFFGFLVIAVAGMVVGLLKSGA